MTRAPYDALTASSAQEGIWVTEQSGVAASVYAMPLVVWFEGDLDVGAFEEACSDVVRRHALLRCSAQYRESRLVLVERAEPALRLITGPAESTGGHRHAMSAEHVALEIERGFNLASGPLYRMSLISVGPQLNMFVAIAHHIIFDGISKDVLLSDLAKAYNARKNCNEPGLNALTQSVADALDEQRRVVDERRADASIFWANRWRSEGTPVLPGLRLLPSVGEAGDACTLEMDADAVDALGVAAKDLGRTRFELLLAGLQVLLFKYGNRGNSVAVDVSTRLGPPEHIGSFVNELPVFVDLQPDMTFKEVALQVAVELRHLNRLRAVPLARAGVRLPVATAVSPVSLSYRARAAVPHFEGLSTKVDWMIFNGTARSALHFQVLDGDVAADGAKRGSAKDCSIVLSVQYSPPRDEWF